MPYKAPALPEEETQLLRRLSFDLIGLPPSIQEIEDFLADTSAQAYEKQVDRLLASPRYGERWAAMWMDLSRYADSHGYTRDEYRETWPYKQWVIEALNKNMSYKDFMIEQIAGDLLPQRNLDNIIATGFHRQTPSNSEGGSDDEEFRMVAEPKTNGRNKMRLYYKKICKIFGFIKPIKLMTLISKYNSQISHGKSSPLKPP